MDKKVCKTCTHQPTHDPTTPCGGDKACVNFSNWQPKGCGSCEHFTLSGHLEPCSECNMFDKWTPEETIKVDLNARSESKNPEVGLKLTEMPPNGERCVSMVEFKGNMYLATEYHIYQLDEEGEIFRAMQFVEDVQ